jgi:hypothetical protein
LYVFFPRQRIFSFAEPFFVHGEEELKALVSHYMAVYFAEEGYDDKSFDVVRQPRAR